MSPKPKALPSEPPRAPQISRQIELAPTQIVGMLLLAFVLILAATGMLTDAGQARDMIWRVTFVYVFLMLAFRFTGKREVGQMSAFELVTLLLIPEIFSSALNRSNDSLSLATVSVTTLFLLVFFTGILTFRFRKIDAVIEGNPTVLVRDGKLLERNLRRERVTEEELFAEMHLAGIERLEDLRWAILETEGKIAFIPARTPASTQQPRGQTESAS
jgi:uncharacterized membrane protein YcaP (DUF421 family)